MLLKVIIHLTLCAEGFQGSEDPCDIGHTNAESYFTVWPQL